jgi:uncharacterized tellurite resistance protein B-like protein
VPWRPQPDEALLCVAILSRDADGSVAPEEAEFISERLAASLERMGFGGQMDVVASLDLTLKGQGLDATLALLRSCLRPEQLPEAVELAIGVAWSDRDLHAREVEHVQHVAAAFGVDQGSLARVFQEAGARVARRRGWKRWFPWLRQPSAST